MIVDEVVIYLKAGRGGEPSNSSLRLSSRRIIGGGGDGGKGGDIILKASRHLYDLNKFLINKNFKAQDGKPGGSNNKKGKNAEDLILNVPIGTIIRDIEGNFIFDLKEDNQEFIAAKGGSGGIGNFKKTYTIEPQDGEEKKIILDYRIPNDLAIVGLPNVGKTSLFNKLTNKSYKVADYPFTTKFCVWANMRIDFYDFVILDTPPIKLNSENKFLKHLLRSKIILFLSSEHLNYKNDFLAIKKEILKFDPELLKNKKVFYLLTKADKISKIEDKNIILVSVEDNKGIDYLKEKVFKFLSR